MISLKDQVSAQVLPVKQQKCAVTSSTPNKLRKGSSKTLYSDNARSV